MKYGIDFDGVICERTGIPTGDFLYFAKRKPIKNSLEAIEWLIECGHEIYIFTAHDSQSEVEEWLKVWKFPKLRVTNIKESGTKAFVDDRAIRFENNWQSIRKLLE